MRLFDRAVALHITALETQRTGPNRKEVIENVSTKIRARVFKHRSMRLWLLRLRMRHFVPSLLLHKGGRGMFEKLPGPIKKGTGWTGRAPKEI